MLQYTPGFPTLLQKEKNSWKLTGQVAWGTARWLRQQGIPWPLRVGGGNSTLGVSIWPVPLHNDMFLYAHTQVKEKKKCNSYSKSRWINSQWGVREENNVVHIRKSKSKEFPKKPTNRRAGRKNLNMRALEKINYRWICYFGKFRNDIVLYRPVVQAKPLPSRVLITAGLVDCFLLIGRRSQLGLETLTWVSSLPSQPAVCNSCMP